MTTGTYNTTREAKAARPPREHSDFAWTPENADAPAILGSLDVVFGEVDR